MAIIIDAVTMVVEGVKFGIGLAEGTESFSDGMYAILGNVVTKSISEGIDQVDYKDEVYWSPYVEVPGVGDVYARPSLVVVGNTSFCFYQGDSVCSGASSGEGGYPYYVANAHGYAEADQLCAFSAFTEYEGQALPSPPTAVVFGGKVYAFYGGMPGGSGQTGQIWYTAYDGTTWSDLILLPDVILTYWDNIICAVAPVAFTPPGSQTEQLYIFYPMIPAGYTGSIVNYDGALDIGCIATTDGQTWSAVSVNVTGISPGNPSILAPVVYTAPGAASGQIYIFCTDYSEGPPVLKYITYPDSNGGFSAPAAVENVSAFLAGKSPCATVYTPPDATDPLIYVFYVDGANNIWLSTFDGDVWSASSQVQNAWMFGFDLAPSAAVFPPGSFGNNMSTATDIYINTVLPANPIQGEPGSLISAAFVGGLSQYSAGVSPSQVTAFPSYDPAVNSIAGVVNSYLLPASLPGFTAPQPWLFYSTYPDIQTWYAVYTESVWFTCALPTPIVESTVTSGAVSAAVGSPSVAPVPTGMANNPSTALLAFNTLTGAVTGCLAGSPLGTWILMPPVPGVASSSSPSLVSYNNLAYMFYQGIGGQAGQLWCTTYDNTAYCSTGSSWNAAWSAAEQVSGVACSEAPSAVVFNGDLYVFYQGGGGNGELWYCCLSGSSGAWSQPTQVIPDGATGTSVLLSGSPFACVNTDSSGNSQLFVVYAGAGSAGNWQLTYCTLGSDGAWTQSIVPGALIADSPSAYAVSGEGKLNVLFQPASMPGQLLYCVYNGSSWSPAATLPVTTLEGWVSCVMYQDGAGAWCYLLYNNSGANAGQIGYCPCAVSNSAQGCLAPCQEIMQPDGAVQNLPLMSGAPAATVANNDIYLFYNYTAYTYGQTEPTGHYLAYMQIPLPSSPQAATLDYQFDLPTLVGNGGASPIANSPTAATFQSNPYVFFNNNGSLAYYSDPSGGENILATSIESACSPSAIVYNNTLYVFYVSDSLNSANGNLCVMYTQDGSTWNQEASWLSVAPQGVTANQYNDQIYIAYQDEATGITYYDLWTTNPDNPSAPTVPYLQPTPISRMACSTGPSVVIFNDQLWCLSQGVNPETFRPLKGWQISPAGYMCYASTFDGQYWTWNTGINATMGPPAASTTLPAAVVFPSTDSATVQTASTDDMLYLFYVDTNGHISYVMTDGAYNSSSSSTPAYGLSWLPSQTIMTPVDSSPAYAQCSPGVAAMPPLDSSDDPDQLYVFWQGAGNSGKLYYATLGTTSGWSEATQIVPAGCSAGQAIMSQSPSVVVYAPEGSSSSQAYVFYQQSGSSGNPGNMIGLSYCVYSADAWTSSQVPNISDTTPVNREGLDVGAVTYDGIQRGNTTASDCVQWFALCILCRACHSDHGRI